MSVPTATIIGAVLAGTFGIAGVLVGLFAERFLRSRGRVYCVTEPVLWTFRYDMGPGEERRPRHMSGLGRIGRGDVAQATLVEYRVGIDFYNERDLPASLRAFEVLFHQPGQTPMTSVPKDGRTWRTQNVGGRAVGSTTDPLKVLNLLPRQLLSLEVRGMVPDPTRLEGCDRVELRAESPGGARFSHELARLDPSVVLTG